MDKGFKKWLEPVPLTRLERDRQWHLLWSMEHEGVAKEVMNDINTVHVMENNGVPLETHPLCIY